MVIQNLKIGQALSSSRLAEIFGEKSLKTTRFIKDKQTVVVIADYTKGRYPDKWIGDTLYLTGSGAVGNQKISGLTNSCLADSRTKKIHIQLFQTMKTGEYIYCGPAHLAGDPITQHQPDKNGEDRLIWIFPIKPDTHQNFPKPAELIFENMEDYQTRGDRAVLEYVRRRDGYRGCKVSHREHGEGTVTGYDGKIITVTFENFQTKTYDFNKSFGGGFLKFVA